MDEKSCIINARKVSFAVSGEFITEIAREWFWAEERPYHKVMDFMTSCMAGTGMEKSELTKLAQGVLLGKKKFIGNTRDNTYGMVEDDTDIWALYPFGVSKLFSNGEIAKMFAAEVEYLKWEEKRLVIAALGQDDYGWLTPDGSWYPVSFGNHQGWAYDFIMKHLDTDEFHRYMEKNESRDVLYKAGDFLQENGWALLSNASGLDATLYKNPNRQLTKKQQDFLFTYFTKRGMQDKAADIMFM